MYKLKIADSNKKNNELSMNNSTISPYLIEIYNQEQNNIRNSQRGNGRHLNGWNRNHNLSMQ